MSNHILKGTVTVSVRKDGDGNKEINYTNNKGISWARITVTDQSVYICWTGRGDATEPDCTAMARLLAVVARRARKEEEKLK